MLIPKGLAMAATPENKKRIQSQTNKVAAERAQAVADFKEAAAKLDGETVTVSVTANPKGHLFEALKEEAIAAALNDKGVAIAATHVIIGTPIKEVGTHDVTLASGDEKISLTLEVVAH